MLRVTNFDEQPDRVTLKVEGRLTGSAMIGAVSEACSDHLRQGRAVYLDLRDVMAIDHAAAVTLRALQTGPVYLTGVPPLIQEVLAEEDTP